MMLMKKVDEVMESVPLDVEKIKCQDRGEEDDVWSDEGGLCPRKLLRQRHP